MFFLESGETNNLAYENWVCGNKLIFGNFWHETESKLSLLYASFSQFLQNV